MLEPAVTGGSLADKLVEANVRANAGRTPGYLLIGHIEGDPILIGVTSGLAGAIYLMPHDGVKVDLLPLASDFETLVIAAARFHAADLGSSEGLDPSSVEISLGDLGLTGSQLETWRSLVE